MTLTHMRCTEEGRPGRVTRMDGGVEGAGDPFSLGYAPGTERPKLWKKATGLLWQVIQQTSDLTLLTEEGARSHFSDQASSKARCEVAIRFNMFHRPAL